MQVHCAYGERALAAMVKGHKNSCAPRLPGIATLLLAIARRLCSCVKLFGKKQESGNKRGAEASPSCRVRDPVHISENAASRRRKYREGPQRPAALDGSLQEALQALVLQQALPRCRVWRLRARLGKLQDAGQQNEKQRANQERYCRPRQGALQSRHNLRIGRHSKL